MAIRQIIPTKKGIGLILNEEISASSDTKTATNAKIYRALGTYYCERRDAHIRPQNISKQEGKTSWPIDRIDGGYHGLVSIVYNGQKRIKVTSVNPPYWFTSESFTIFFNHGTKEMRPEDRERVALEEREEFREFFGRYFRL